MQTLHELWTRAKRVLRTIGDFQARVLLTILYFVMIAPVGLIVRVFSDSLRARHDANASTYWIPREAKTTVSPEELLRQARDQG